MAVQNGDQEIVNLLVDYQADINSPNYRRVTPLAMACKRQDWQLVNHLLDKKARGVMCVLYCSNNLLIVFVFVFLYLICVFFCICIDRANRLTKKDVTL